MPNPPVSLARVQQEIETMAQRHGFLPETRKFSPHLTLARFREPRPDRRFAELAKELEDYHFGTSRVHEIVLYQSILRPQGAEYQALHKFPLSGAR
jgi:2'-5' RNA ligase